MTIDQFIRKWCPPNIDRVQEFQEDLFKATTGRAFQSVAIDVLSGVEGSELRIFDVDENNTAIAYGAKGDIDSIQIWASKPIGIQEFEWRQLLKFIASYYVKQQKNG